MKEIKKSSTDRRIALLLDSAKMVTLAKRRLEKLAVGTPEFDTVLLQVKALKRIHQKITDIFDMNME